MKDEFSNRLASFSTTLDFANVPEHKTVWETQVPKAFGTKLGQLATEVTTLRQWCQRQGESILGAAEAKEIEEKELETAAFEMAQALVTCLMDAGHVADAEPFRRTVSWWQGLRDQDLLTRSQDVIEAATPLTTGAGATANADNYGISTTRLAALVAARADYLAIVSAPATARSGKKGYTALMREKFVPVTLKFRDLDRLVPQFRPRPGGEAFVSGWFAARQVVDAGHGPGTGGEPGGGGPLPGAPQNPGVSTGVPDSGAVMFQWAENHPDDVVTAYKVYRDGVLLATVSAPDISVILDGFTSGESVTLTVSAVNANGEGPQSEAGTGTAG